MATSWSPGVRPRGTSSAVRYSATPLVVGTQFWCRENLALLSGLELLTSSKRVSNILQGGFFLRKKPLGGYGSLYSNWRTAAFSVSRNIVFC